jgi:hypothetical protein
LAEEQRRALRVIWKVVVPWLARRTLRFKRRRKEALRLLIKFRGLVRGRMINRRTMAVVKPDWWELAGENAERAAETSAKAAKEASRRALALAKHVVTAFKRDQERYCRLNFLMIARAKRLAARLVVKRARERVPIAGVSHFCRSLPRWYTLKQLEDERWRRLRRSTQRVAFLKELAARAPKPAPAAAPAPEAPKPRERPKKPPPPAEPPAPRPATRLLSAVRWGRIQGVVRAGTAPPPPRSPPFLDE